MNRITIANGDIGFNFTDGNLIKKIFVDKLTQAQLINGRLAIARLLVDNNSEGEYAIIPASVADKIAQRDASSIVLHSAPVPKSRMKTIRMPTSKCLMI